MLREQPGTPAKIKGEIEAKGSGAYTNHCLLLFSKKSKKRKERQIWAR